MSDAVVIVIISSIFGGGGFVAILQMVKWYIERRNPVTKGLIDVSKIFDILQTCKSHLGAVRIVLIKLHNGGGRPKAGNAMYSSAVYEVYSDNQKPITKNWQNERIDNDPQYRDMLISMFDHGHIRLKIVEMDDGKLKDVYIAMGVKRNIVRSVGYKDMEHFYISAVFTNENGNESIENDAMRVCVNRIKEILNCS